LPLVLGLGLSAGKENENQPAPQSNPKSIPPQSSWPLGPLLPLGLGLGPVGAYRNGWPE
jgi:hypothetical protein